MVVSIEDVIFEVMGLKPPTIDRAPDRPIPWPGMKTDTERKEYHEAEIYWRIEKLALAILFEKKGISSPSFSIERGIEELQQSFLKTPFALTPTNHLPENTIITTRVTPLMERQADAQAIAQDLTTAIDRALSTSSVDKYTRRDSQTRGKRGG